MDDWNGGATVVASGRMSSKALSPNGLMMSRAPTHTRPAAEANPSETAGLSDFSLFDGLKPETLQSAEFAARMRLLGKGQIQFLPGDRADAVCFLVAGRIKISRLTESGRELILDIVEPGDFFGEIGVVIGARRETMAEAIETARFWAVPAAGFLALVRRAPELLRRLTLRLASRQKVLERRLIDAAHHNTSRRLSALLLELSRTYGSPGSRGISLRIKLSQAALGNMLGVSRETINHELVRFRERGAIEFVQGRILIRHPAALVASASPKASSTVNSVTPARKETCSV